MARKIFYRRFRRRLGKWSPNIRRISLSGTAQANSVFSDFVTIAQNNTVTSPTTISQIFTVKNVEVSAQLSADVPDAIENLEYYIMYVPQGFGLDANLPFAHPEWIMAYKFIGTPIAEGTSVPSTSNAQVPRIKTRLSRKLNTGDTIVFMITGRNAITTDSINVRYTGLIRWWTKAN